MSSVALRREAPHVSQPRRAAEIVSFSKPEAVVETLLWRNPADMHRGFYAIALAAWGAFLSVFWLTFAMSANALFMVTISTVYAAVFFSVPVILTRLFPEKLPVEGSLSDFLRAPFATIDGPIKGYEALVQMIVVPVCLVIGGAAISIIIHAARASH
jgi:hypothetical protein